jgi:UDP-N-acetylmuramyl pentapeptide phosphotransferase/UDP-N-acetylglucosamine-1-phosphate transferase
MGDSGSLIIGLIVAVLAIKIVEFSTLKLPVDMSRISKPIFAMSAIVYPMMDTLRIFLVRTIKGRSPFSADRNHLHHKLIDLGFSHKGTSFIIYGFTVSTILLAVLLPLEANLKFVVMSVLVVGLSQLVPFLAHRKANGSVAEVKQ